MKTTFMFMVLVVAMIWSYSNAQPTDPEGCLKAFRSTSTECLESIKGILHEHIHGIKNLRAFHNTTLKIFFSIPQKINIVILIKF
ncbi:hypothetical protein DY000_02034074 [Brassica cretica]|uniref:Pectinesterase inhibitor domain-containing protein n=1 Tax=Brassica cretica TaxID=69181 RepID=A0ABQ7DQW3_BRACR|nr:hypothetical protein DY000_02034074 [Brassica cretica]